MSVLHSRKNTRSKSLETAGRSNFASIKRFPMAFGTEPLKIAESLAILKEIIYVSMKILKGALV
jgi:hypothetical protein